MYNINDSSVKIWAFLTLSWSVLSNQKLFSKHIKAKYRYVGNIKYFYFPILLLHNNHWIIQNQH
jgi:hypothetical protein